VELEKLAYAASAPPVAGLADAGGKAAERFKTPAERWKADEKRGRRYHISHKHEGLRGEHRHIYGAHTQDLEICRTAPGKYKSQRHTPRLAARLRLPCPAEF